MRRHSEPAVFRKFRIAASRDASSWGPGDETRRRHNGSVPAFSFLRVRVISFSLTCNNRVEEGGSGTAGGISTGNEIGLSRTGLFSESFDPRHPACIQPEITTAIITGVNRADGLIRKANNCRSPFSTVLPTVSPQIRKNIPGRFPFPIVLNPKDIAMPSVIRHNSAQVRRRFSSCPEPIRHYN